VNPSTVCLDRATAGRELAPVAEIRLSLDQVCMLLQAVLPQPVFDGPAALRLPPYQQRRKAAAYRSHRKRRLWRLDELRTNVLSL
jgi:hypothetical protein